MMKRAFHSNGRVRRTLWAVLLCIPFAALGAGPAGTPPLQVPAFRQIEHGRYLVQIAGCNDCHTPGYGASGGKVLEQDWLVGDKLGFSGPWGTTYPSNLRLLMARMTEQQWLTLAQRTQLRPPMPWFNLRAMKEADLKAIYRYVTWLGPKGEPAPAYLPPDKAPQGPVVVFPSPPAP